MTTLRNAAEGRPFRSPLHPALVHLPIGLLPLGTLLDIASHLWPQPELNLVRAAAVAVGAGIAGALLAAIFGFVDYNEIRRDHPARKTATQHMIFNLMAVALFGLGFWARVESWHAVSTPALPLVLSLVGLALVSYSGYLGGHLVYSDGVAVGRHRRDTALPKTTVLVKGEPGTQVVVTTANQLRDGDTVRVDANGVIVSIARLKGQLHAFQDFCTHRYAPLSEGAFNGCEVICPWHRSRFDVRTGKVTEGPAKVDLRTFDVEERDGRVWLKLPPPAKSSGQA